MSKKYHLTSLLFIFLILTGSLSTFSTLSSSKGKQQEEVQFHLQDAPHLPVQTKKDPKEKREKEALTPTTRTEIPPSFTNLTTKRGNITSFVSPDSSYEAIVSEIQRAENSIYILMYQFYHPQLFSALKDAVVNRSVALTIVLENDTYPWGIGTKDQYNRYYASKFWNLSKDHEVNVYWETEWPYMHSKLVLIDNQTTIVMSANMNPGSIPPDLDGTKTEYGEFSRQWGVIIHGKEASKPYLSNILWELNHNIAPYDRDRDGTGTEPSPSKTVSYAQNFTTTSRSDVPFTPVFSPNNSFDVLNKSIYAADHFILLQLMYISWGSTTTNLANQLVYALGNATARNVTVMVMLEEEMPDYEETKEVLEKRGIHVIPANATQGFPLFIHNKGVLIDDTLAFVGSVNWSQYSLKYNRETGALINSSGITRWFKGVYEEDWRKTGREFDSDGDGLPDIFENEHGFNPNKTDTNGDGTTDYEEVFRITPSVTITTPSSGEKITLTRFTIKWSGRGGGASIDHYEVRINNETWKNVANETTYEVNVSQDGEYWIEVRIFNKEGEIAQDSVRIIVDTTPPSISFLTKNETYFATANPSIQWTGSDNGTGVKTFQYRVDGGDWHNKTTANLTLSGLTEGEHSITVWAYDWAGNIKDATLVFTVDTIKPSTTIHNPSDGATVSDTVTIIVTGEDVHFKNMSLYIAGNLEKTWTSAGTYTYDWDSTTVKGDTYAVKVVAYDTLGQHDTTSIEITVQNEGEKGGGVSPVVIAGIGISVAIAAAAVAIYFLKIRKS